MPNDWERFYIVRNVFSIPMKIYLTETEAKALYHRMRKAYKHPILKKLFKKQKEVPNATR